MNTKKKYASHKLKQRAYMERKRAKQEVADDLADVEATIKQLNLCGFSEVASGVYARTWLEEIQVHRSWLRALEQPDVLPGETLYQLAKRTWQALLGSKGYGVTTDGGGKWEGPEGDRKWVPGFCVWYPLFSPSQQHFQVPFDSTRYPGGPFGEGIRDAAKPEWFETHWRAPDDCTGNEPIDIASLPPLPPVPKTRNPEPKPKPSPRVAPVIDVPPIVTGYETPLEEQNKFSGLGTFGVSRTSHS